jgi:hypothetical protein
MKKFLTALILCLACAGGLFAQSAGEDLQKQYARFPEKTEEARLFSAQLRAVLADKHIPGKAARITWCYSARAQTRRRRPPNSAPCFTAKYCAVKI